jgi:hypothetical protein
MSGVIVISLRHSLGGGIKLSDRVLYSEVKYCNVLGCVLATRLTVGCNDVLILGS